MKPSTGTPVILHIEIGPAVLKAILTSYGVRGWNRWLVAMRNGGHFGGLWSEGESEPPMCIWVDVTGAHLTGHNLDGIMLGGIVSCDGITLDGGSAVGAHFASCRNASFRGANLARSSFCDDISGADFSNASLDGASFSEASFYLSNPPVGLPVNLMAQCFAVDRGEVSETNGQDERHIPITATIHPSATWQ